MCVRRCENLIYLQLVAERVYVDIDFYDSRNDIAKSSQCPVNCTDSIPHTDPVRWILSFKYIYRKKRSSNRYDSDVFLFNFWWVLVRLLFFFFSFSKQQTASKSFKIKHTLRQQLTKKIKMFLSTVYFVCRSFHSHSKKRKQLNSNNWYWFCYVKKFQIHKPPPCSFFSDLFCSFWCCCCRLVNTLIIFLWFNFHTLFTVWNSR